MPSLLFRQLWLACSIGLALSGAAVGGTLAALGAWPQWPTVDWLLVGLVSSGVVIGGGACLAWLGERWAYAAWETLNPSLAALRADRTALPPLTETAIYLHELGALRATLQALARQTDLPQLLAHMATRTRELLCVDQVIILEADPARRLLVLAASTFEDHPPRREMTYGEGVAGRAAETRRTIVVYDYATAPERVHLPYANQFQGVLAVPMQWQGALIGVLNVAVADGQRRFTPGELALAEQLATQTAVALNSARLYTATQQQTKRLESLHQASDLITRTLNPEQIYTTTIDVIGRLMPVEVVGFFVWTAATQQLECAYWVEGGQKMPLPSPPHPWGAFLLTVTAPALFPTAAAWPAQLKPLAKRRPAEAAMGVPLHVGERLVGALVVESYAPLTYTAAEAASLRALGAYTASALQNAQLFQATQQQVLQLRVLYEVALAAFNATNATDLVGQALAALQKHVNYPWLGLMLWEPELQMLKLHPSVHTLFPNFGYRFMEPAEQGLLGQVVASGQPCRVTDTLQAPRYARVLPDTRAEMAVPLKISERVIGVLHAETPQVGGFTEADEQLLTVVATLLAPIVDNAQLMNRHGQRLKELGLLNELTQQIVAAPNFDASVRQAVQALHQQWPCEILGVEFWDPDQQLLIPHPSYVGVRDDTHLHPLPLSEGLLGQAARTRRAIRADDASQQPAYRSDTLPVRSQIVVPLLAGDRLVGVLNAASSRLAAFTAADEQQFITVARLLAPLFENGRLRDRAEQQARDLAFLVRAQAAASASLDLSEVLAVVVEQLGHALQVSSAAVVELDETQAITQAEYYSPDALPSERREVHAHYPLALIGGGVEAVRQGQVVMARADDVRLSAMERANLRRSGVRVTLKVPLVRQNRTLGYVELRDSRRDRMFNHAEIQLAQTLAGHAAAALENARLYAAARRHGDQMRLVNHVGRDIAGILEVDELLVQVSRRLEATFGYYHAKVGLVENDTLIFRARYDEHRQLQLPEFRIRLDGPGIIAWVAKNAQARLTANVLNDPHFLPHLLLMDTKAEAATPLLAHGQVIGVLDVQSNRLGELENDTLIVLEAISAQLAVAVENARLFTEARRHAEEVSALLTTTLTVSSSMDLAARLQAIAHHARRLAQADSCTIYKIAPDGRHLVPVIVLDEHYANQTLEDRQLTLGEGLIGFVAQKGVGELINRADLDPRAHQIAGTPLSPENLIAVPLAVGQRVTGVMAVYREGLSEFQAHDFELLTSFAAQAAVALEHAELYHTLVERANSLQVAYNELAEMDRLKDELVQNISHELRTPLTFMKSYVELLLAGEFGTLQPPQTNSLHIVLEKTATLERLVNDITTLQTMSASALQWQALDLGALAEAAATGVAARVQESQLTLALEKPTHAVPVRGDPQRLDQVFSNLLGNALKFTNPGGRLTVRVSATETTARAEVQDTGIGIPLEHQNRIFERFYQVDGSIARRRGGIGLGLAICKIIVEAHGGHIGVSSEPGQGACFYFELPIFSPPPTPSRLAPP